MTEEIYVHVKKGSPFLRLRPAFVEWTNMHMQYTKSFISDRIHFYTEQTNCSILSAAAWKQGFPSLVEFQHPKQHKNDKAININGRIDLFINHKESYYFESKKIYVNLLKPAKSSNPESIQDYVIRGLKNANGDMQVAYSSISDLHSNPDFEKSAVGEILFIVPRLKSIYSPLLADAKDIFTAALMELTGIDALAWCLPNGEEDIDLWGYRYLGIAMVIRNFSPATK